MNDLQEPIGVYLAEDHVMVREGLAQVISQDPQLRVVGQCGDGLKVLSQVQDLQPKVVVLDIGLPGLNGLDLCQELERKCPGVGILILTMHEDEEFVARALGNGASGYLLKEAAADQLREAIRAVARGELFLGPGLPRGILDRIGRSESPHDRLTPRERQVLQLIAEGNNNRQIAEKLGTSPKTIETHRTRLMKKLDIHNVAALIRYALKRGIVQPP